MRSAALFFLWLSPSLATAAPLAETDEPVGEAWLSAGGGIGTYTDAAMMAPTVNVQLSLWTNPALTVDLMGALYPRLAPVVGPTYHLAVAGGEELTHALLFGVDAGALTHVIGGPQDATAGLVGGRGSIDPLLGAHLGYGLVTPELDLRCTLMMVRDLHDLSSSNYFATVSVSVAKIIHSTTRED